MCECLGVSVVYVSQQVWQLEGCFAWRCVGGWWEQRRAADARCLLAARCVAGQRSCIAGVQLVC